LNSKTSCLSGHGRLFRYAAGTTVRIAIQRLNTRCCRTTAQLFDALDARLELRADHAGRCAIYSTSSTDAISPATSTTGRIRQLIRAGGRPLVFGKMFRQVAATTHSPPTGRPCNPPGRPLRTFSLCRIRAFPSHPADFPPISGGRRDQRVDAAIGENLHIAVRPQQEDRSAHARCLLARYPRFGKVRKNVERAWPPGRRLVCAIAAHRPAAPSTTKRIRNLAGMGRLAQP